MIKPQIPQNENTRLQNLNSYQILDTLPEEDYDAITAIASEICGTKISLISLIDKDRQWFKSHHGIPQTETPRDLAFCGHAINKPNEIFHISDARLDDRFYDNPLVTGETEVIFYAGVPLINKEGFPLGTLCVIDNMPKVLSEKQLNTLEKLSKQVVNILELRKQSFKLNELNEKLNEKNANLIQFAHTAAHDIKSPLNNIISITDLVLNEGRTKEEQKQMVDWISSSTKKLKDLIDDLLIFNQADNIEQLEKKDISILSTEKYITELLEIDISTKIKFKSSISTIHIHETVLQQILLNLITNAIKYNDKEISQIEVLFKENDDQYTIQVKDNGMGIPEDKLDKVFEAFKTLSYKDKYGKKGNGIGLATVKRLVEKSKGNIVVSSTIKKGTTFTISLSK